VLFAVAHATLAAMIVWHAAGSLAPLTAALRLLRWLVLPILLLHMFLTPGMMIVTGVPVSWEGLEQGLWLSLHLVEMFFAAMAMSRLLLWREWLQWLASWPRVGGGLATDARLFLLMQRDARLLIEQRRRQWREQPFDLIVLGRLLAETLQQMLARSELQAVRLWRHWHSPRLQAMLAGSEQVWHGGATFVLALLALILAGRTVSSLI